MRTPESTPAAPPASAPSWRAILLWVAFATTLLAGLWLAARLGGSVPALVDGAPR